jgi:hypothetical protein
MYTGLSMVFLIEYSRSQGKLITLRSFKDDQRAFAEDQRLQLELDLHRQKVDHEVVILEAASEAALEKTHARYFQTAAEIAAAFGKSH